MSFPEGVTGSTVGKVPKEDEDLIVSPGSMFWVRGDDKQASFKQCLRLSFS